ncbi:MAG: D-2-hydroxyacid dehydrogenase [Terriglobales bacterium]
MKLLIALQHRFDLWNAPPWFAERLRKEFPDLEVVHRNTYDAATQHLPDADILVSWSIRPEQFALARRLRWIHSPAAAVHALMIPEVIASDVVVTNARQVHGPLVAEHTMALLLALAKRLPSAFHCQQQHLWGQQQLWDDHPRPREVAGATLGLIGLGSIGSEVARRALAFNMNILAIREHPEKGNSLPLNIEGMTTSLDGVIRDRRPSVGRRGSRDLDLDRSAASSSSANSVSSAFQLFGPTDLDHVLSKSEYVVLAAPLTPKTRGLVSAARLARMRPDASLINVSRGALVDETALANALRNRHLAGAALDVFDREPLPPDSPLWDAPNLILTPHSAALTDRLWDRHYALLSENLRRFLSGQTLISVVNKQTGY